MRRVDGYSRCTRALATRRIVATRSATASVLTCNSGVSGLTAAAAVTWSSVRVPSPVTTVWRTAMIGVKYSTRPSATATTAVTADHSNIFRPRMTPRVGALGCSDRPAARRRAS
ncbi:Uncharacterised protein [Mycobacteroides abscessus subsp. abscessus]|nr:Uncharacterised protein [Mycobacteroides abscessus subsp. abscessus]